jgi:Transposase protein
LQKIEEIKRMKQELDDMRRQRDTWKKIALGQRKKTRRIRSLKAKINRDNKILKGTVKKQRKEISQITKVHMQRAKLNEEIARAKGAVSTKARENIIREAMAGFLSKAQVDRLLFSKTTHWSQDDIMTHTVLLSHSSRAYRCLREEMRYPLPAVSTLKAHVAKLPVEPGLLKAAIILMQARAKCMGALEKLTSISFDEIHVSKEYAYDEKEDSVLGGNSKTQVVMARGTFADWKSPVYYQQNQPVTEELLDSVIRALHEAGFVVVSIVSDMATENQKLYSEMGVSATNPYFMNTVTGEHIACFHDAPHLLKLARNHLVDEGLILNPSHPKPEQLVACVEPLQQLIKVGLGNDLPPHKVTQHHLSCKGCDRQIVRLAAQVLSQSTAVSLKIAAEDKVIKSDHCLVSIL